MAKHLNIEAFFFAIIFDRVKKYCWSKCLRCYWQLLKYAAKNNVPAIETLATPTESWGEAEKASS